VKSQRVVLFVLAAIAAVLLLASCKPRGANQSLSKPLSEPIAPVAARPTAKQIAVESLARALASPPAQNGMRLAAYCPIDDAMAQDACFNDQVTAELIGDIGRRIRQGAGVLIVEVSPRSAAAPVAADCGKQVNLLSFKLAPANGFPKGAIRPMLNSLCYSIVSQAKLTDCQCLGNISKALAGLTTEAKTRGAVLAILDARRFGAWESGPAEQDAATVDAPGFDLVYALIPKPKDFDALAPLDFVSAAQAQATAGGGGLSRDETTPLRIELPDTDAIAPQAGAPTVPPAAAAPAATSVAPPAAPPAADTGADAKSTVKKSGSQKSESKSGSKDKSKKKSTSKTKGKDKTKSKDKDKQQSTDKQTGAAAQ